MNLDIYFLGILLGMKPSKFEIMPFGFRISFKLQLSDYRKRVLRANLLELKKIIVAISGPVINQVIIIIVLLLNIDYIEKEQIIYSNVLIVLFNLLPIYPLDGGRILKGIIHVFLGGRIARIVTNKIANVTMILITSVASIGILYFKNIAIFFIIIFLWIIVINENKKFKIINYAYNLLL